jgi:hypothetical protein
MPGRNDPCPCGSGKKYKRCHLLEDDKRRVRERAPIHDSDEQLLLAILHNGMREFDFSPPAMINDVFGRDPQRIPIAMQWLAHIVDFDGLTLRGWFLSEHGDKLSSDEKALLDAQSKAWLSIWEVTAVEKGRGLHLTDLLTGEKRFVHEISGSLTAEPMLSILARVVDFEGESYFMGTHPQPLPPHAVSGVLDAARRAFRLRNTIPADRLRGEKAAGVLFGSWHAAIERLRQPPTLVNTSGDDILFTTDHYLITPGRRGDVEKRLQRLPGAQKNEEEITVVREEETVVATIFFRGDQLDVETNSLRRADSIRTEVEELLGDMIQRRGRVHTDPTEAFGRETAPPVEEENDPEMDAVVRQYKEQHYQDWLDEEIPILGGITPRKAAKSAAGRRKLLDLLLDDCLQGIAPAGIAAVRCDEALSRAGARTVRAGAAFSQF